MSQHYELRVRLTLLGPILTRGGRPTDPGIDAPMARDAFDRFMLPYSLVKGKVLDAFKDLRGESDPVIRNWLGKASGNGSWEPERGRLRFSDFVTDQKQNAPDDDHIIDRIQIDAANGSAAERMRMMIEAPFGYGEEVTFTGRVEFIADAEEATRIRDEVTAAFRWVASYGAMRTIGFGRTRTVTTELVERTPSTASSPKSVGDTLPFQLSLDRPLCIVGPKHSRNHYDSLQNISGAVLKGALARLILELNGSPRTVIEPENPCARFPTLCRHFATLRIAEARPMPADATTRPVVPPLSVVTSPTREGKWFDVAREEKPLLIDKAAPAFASDWKPKDEAVVHNAFGVVNVPRERRTRTAIDREKGRAAEAQLFSFGLVVPETPKKKFVWEGAIGLEGIPKEDHAAVRDELRDLLRHGLPNIGKTRATGSVRWLDRQTPPHVGTATIPDGLHVLTLQTDCLMTDPDILTAKADDPLHDAYAEFWKDVSDGALTLERFFARQTLHGGFVSNRSRQEKYEPFLLTDCGSVFVLKATDAARGKPLIDEWRTHGLPTPNWVQRRYGSDGTPLWRTCPFLREVGYGEVVVDLSCHQLVPEGDRS